MNRPLSVISDQKVPIRKPAEHFVNEAVEALICGDSNYAVIPQENAIGGAVIDYVDTLLAQTEVSVIGEVELPINQNLLALPGTKLESINTVYSHNQGITH